MTFVALTPSTLVFPDLVRIDFVVSVFINLNVPLFERGSQDETIDSSVFKLPTNLHRTETPVDVVAVHIEVVTLEWMSIHSRID